MVGWHHRLNGHGFGQTLGVGDGQGGAGVQPQLIQGIQKRDGIGEGQETTA